MRPAASFATPAYPPMEERTLPRSPVIAFPPDPGHPVRPDTPYRGKPPGQRSGLRRGHRDRNPPVTHGAWRVRVGTTLLWLLIALAAAGGLRGLVGGPPATPLRATPPSADAGGAGGFAQLFVAAYLEAGAGQEQTLRPFYAGHLDLTGVAPAGRYASRTAATAAREVAAGYWAVTVGADVLVAAKGTYVSAGTHYYEVGIALSNQGEIATSLPAEVSPPKPAHPPTLAFAALAPPDQGSAIADALRTFFAAYLAGQGDLAAVASPGSGLTAVAPAPLASVELTGVVTSSVPIHGTNTTSAAGSELVEAEVTGTDTTGAVGPLDYTLRISQRQGQWRVDQILPAPPLAVPSN